MTLVLKKTKRTPLPDGQKFDDMFIRLDIIPAFYAKTDRWMKLVKQQYWALHAVHADARLKLDFHLHRHILNFPTKSYQHLM